MDFYAFYIIYILFHLKKWHDRPEGKTAKENSVYYKLGENGEYRANPSTMIVPFRRALIMTTMQICIILTFTFATKGGLN